MGRIDSPYIIVYISEGDSVIDRYIKATTLLPDYIIEELKKKTGEKTNKEALAKAIYHYMGCIDLKTELKREEGKISVSE
ncbi:MAG TPA: hypothetical protein EYP30_01195 [Archaeoglobaceae archaeon]|nr:hypothetical protein [Archaeoglobaceae archaeon]